MKLKLNADGFAEVVDGKPVYVYDDGTETPFDAAQQMARFKAVNDEAKGHRLKAKEIQEQFDEFKTQFGDIDLESAKKALATVQALDQKDLIKASEVERLKETVRQSFQEEKAQLIKGHQQQLDDMTEKLNSSESTIHQMVLKDAFTNSPYFAGEEPKTTYAPWEALAVFGDYFKIEGDGAQARPVAYLNGEKILSRENYAEPAKFDEAVAQIIASNPDRFNKILVTNGGGGGGGGNQQRGGNGPVVTSGDNDAFIKNLENIATGKVTVRM